MVREDTYHGGQDTSEVWYVGTRTMADTHHGMKKPPNLLGGLV